MLSGIFEVELEFLVFFLYNGVRHKGGVTSILGRLGVAEFNSLYIGGKIVIVGKLGLGELEVSFDSER